MIDIDKLTEAQVRYIMKGLVEADDFNIDNIMGYCMEHPDYPQQTNNEESDND